MLDNQEQWQQTMLFCRDSRAFLTNNLKRVIRYLALGFPLLDSPGLLGIALPLHAVLPLSLPHPLLSYPFKLSYKIVGFHTTFPYTLGLHVLFSFNCFLFILFGLILTYPFLFSFVCYQHQIHFLYSFIVCVYVSILYVAQTAYS